MTELEDENEEIAIYKGACKIQDKKLEELGDV